MATTLLEYFNELRNQNPFSWVKDSEITAVEPGQSYKQMIQSIVISEGIYMVPFVLV